MGRIRPFVENDIPQLVELYIKIFRPEDRSSPQAWMDYFEEYFFRNPWRDASLPSLVYCDARGKIVGFLGILPRRMSMNGRPIRVAFGGQLMIEPSVRSSMAVLQLVRTFLSGPQELSLADSANDLARKIWEGLGGTAVLLYSIHWTRVLRPAELLVSRLEKRKLPGLFVSTLRRLCRPLDETSFRIKQSPFHFKLPLIAEEELTEAKLYEWLSQFSTYSSLKPEYDPDSLRWIMKMLDRKKGFGSLEKIVLRDKNQEILGLYLYYLIPGGMSQVVIIAGRNNSIGDVLDHLFHHARRRGAAAICGRFDPCLMNELPDKLCLFSRGSWMLAHSRDPELLETIQRGDACITPFDGENIIWSTNFV